MAITQKYTDDQRAHALRLYTEHGPTHAAQQTGIATATIFRWVRAADLRPPGKQTSAWAERRAAIADQFGEVAELMLARADAATASRDARQYLVAAAIAVDKAQLLSGGPTVRGADSSEDALTRVKNLRDELAVRRQAITDRAAQSGHPSTFGADDA